MGIVCAVGDAIPLPPALPGIGNGALTELFLVIIILKLL